MLHRFLIVIAAALLAACTAQPVTGVAGGARTGPIKSVWADTGCELRRAETIDGFAYGPAMSGETIRLLNWNAHKHAGQGLHADLARFAAQADLLLLQEAVVDDFHMERIDPAFYWVFAPGYVQGDTPTGVLTASRARPAKYCRLSNMEPWLGSPKATTIALYPLEGRSDNLLVINVHLINFTIGLQAMTAQLDAAMHFVAQHQGPVIVSGDFNTWNNGRNRLVDMMLMKAGLQSVDFAIDERTRFFGHAVDHVYVRGLRSARATTHSVDSSDHNPLEVLLEVI